MEIKEDEIKRICSATIYKRGLEYYKEGRVHMKVRAENSLVAAVDGDKLYNVHISFDGEKIADTLCTCPYYITMGTACKHIVATLKTRQQELLKTNDFENENDLLASRLCEEFKEQKKEQWGVFVKLRVTFSSGKIFYSAALDLVGNNSKYQIHSVEAFLDSYLNHEDFRLSKNCVFNRGNCVLEEASAEIVSMLCEAYENKSLKAEFYSLKNYEISFGAQTARRLFPLLKRIGASYIIDGMNYDNVAIVNDDPDILVDVSAIEKRISILLTESGIALVPDGEIFFFDNKIFITTSEWREWFMPLYRAMILKKRTRLEFVGDNSVEFAAKVLPKIKNARGVVCYGIDELVVSETPEFEIYLDSSQKEISAVIKASYGGVSMILPSAVYSFDKLIIRDEGKEEEILEFFKEFELEKDRFYLSDEVEIFKFITRVLTKLNQKARVFTSDSFDSLLIEDLPSLSAYVSYNEKIDLLQMEIDGEIPEEEIREILEAYYQNYAFYRFSDGRFFDFSKKNSTLEFLLALPENENIKGKRNLSKSYALYLAQEIEKGKIKGHESFFELIKRGLECSYKIPDYLNGVLRDYQKNGVRWFFELAGLGLGGILADDMGLGKTLQVIAFVMSSERKAPSLVVAPSSLLYNWWEEIMRFAPDARVKIIDGPKEAREEALLEIGDCDFVITSYALLRRDVQIYQDLEFSYCFIDEAQHIKNSRTMNFRAVKRIKAKSCFALTGTPIENSISELWSIFDFVLPGYLSSKERFLKNYEKSISKGIMSAGEELSSRVKPFILRRMKKDVLKELPEKIENTIFADFKDDQKKVYYAFLSAAREEAEFIASTGENKIRILSLLTRLRQICCHPALINPDYKRDSAKLELLSELVSSAVSSGHRVLVFSQFTSMLSIIAEELRKKSITSFYLDGSTPKSERVSMANRFNAGEKDVFLISLKAGGTGLNLIGADTVIHYDPWWNPAVMDQASDRAYRIGQTKAVQVIKLVCRNSIEEKIMKLSEKKRGLADGIIRENKSFLSALSKEELLDLFEEKNS